MSKFTVKLSNPPSDLNFWYARARDEATYTDHDPTDGEYWREPTRSTPLESPQPCDVHIFFSQKSVNNGAGYFKAGSGAITIPEGATVIYDVSINKFTIETPSGPPIPEDWKKWLPWVAAATGVVAIGFLIFRKK